MLYYFMSRLSLRTCLNRSIVLRLRSEADVIDRAEVNQLSVTRMGLETNLNGLFCSPMHN